jgi:hypothetical protein
MFDLSASEIYLNNYSDEEKEMHMVDAEAELEERYHIIVNNRYKTDETYTQLMQIVLPTVNVDDESLIICIDKSTAKKELYIYLPPYGNDYIFPINAALKVPDLLNYIYNLEEFKKCYPTMQFEFILTLTMDCEPEEYDSESFLELTLDKIPTSQAILIEQS